MVFSRKRFKDDTTGIYFVCMNFLSLNNSCLECLLDSFKSPTQDFELRFYIYIRTIKVTQLLPWLTQFSICVMRQLNQLETLQVSQLPTHEAPHRQNIRLYDILLNTTFVRASYQPLWMTSIFHF